MYNKLSRILILSNFRKTFDLKRCFGTVVKENTQDTIIIQNTEYKRDSWSNVTPKILSYLNKNLYLIKNHPLSLIRQRIIDHFYTNFQNRRGNPIFSVHDRLSPVVTIEQNFDNLLIPKDHVSRAKNDCYYINENYLLRAHATAHQLDFISSGLDNFLIVGEVYRRDEIDSTHYPVFHQMDAVHLKTREELFDDQDLNIFEPTQFQISHGGKNEKQACHTLEAVKLMEHSLKSSLLGVAKHLFGENIEHRWVDQYFPFTQPSWELEIFYNNQWLEVLGCGIIRNEILQHGGVHDKIGWAFGLGLERLAMILYQIPDIRLFWSNDSGFLNQFKVTDINQNIKYKPISAYPQCINDISFWLPENNVDNFSSNDFYDIVRSVAGDIVEQVSLIDSFKHPKTGRFSHCYRIIYRHMERTLTQEEVNRIHKKIEDTAVSDLEVKIR